jgi:hypothetical protein
MGREAAAATPSNAPSIRAVRASARVTVTLSSEMSTDIVRLIDGTTVLTCSVNSSR